MTSAIAGVNKAGTVSFTDVSSTDGLKRTQEMAVKMAKPWVRLVEIFKAI